jgi:acetyltransferase-like isoleucine patch superfamily enzyme
MGQNVSIGQGVTFGHYVIIYDNVHIGDHTSIGDFCIIGERNSNLTAENQPLTKIGNNCMIRSHSIIFSGAILADYVQTGNRACIREESIVGSHSMIGYQSELQGHCIVGDYVRIQSNVSVGKTTKIGDFVYIYPYSVFTNDNTPPSGPKDGPSVGNFTQIGTSCIIMPGAKIGQFSLVGAGSKVSGTFGDDVFVQGSPAKDKGKLSKMPFINHQGKKHYPWPINYDQGLPWQGKDFITWAEEEGLKLPDIF